MQTTDKVHSSVQMFGQMAMVDPEASLCQTLLNNMLPIEGGIYLMYHGTSRQAAGQILANGFRQSSGGMLGRGVYVSRDLQKASIYPRRLPESQRAVLKLRVRVGKVKKIDYQGHPMQKTWHDYGYDSAWCPPHCGMVRSGLEEDCIWDPDRITVLNIVNTQSGLSTNFGSVVRQDRVTYSFDLNLKW